MKKIAQRFAAHASASTCLVILSACAGGGTSEATSPISPPAIASSKTALVHLRFVVAKKTTSPAARLKQYVSASTQSLTLTVTPPGEVAQSPIYVACTTTCVADFTAPVGADGIALQLTDGPNGSGHQLSLVTTTISVAANAANTFNLTADPVVSSAAVLLGSSPAATASTNAGSTADIPVTVSAFDADGNTIVGPGNYVDASGNPITFSLSVTNAQAGGTGTVTLNGATTFSAPGASTATAHYDGNWLDHSVITATSTSGMVTTPVSATLATTPYVVEYPLAGTPDDLAIGPDHQIWVTQNSLSEVARVATSGALLSEISSGFGGGDNLRGIVTRADGTVWVAQQSANCVAHIDTSGVLGTACGGFAIRYLTAASDGSLWSGEDGGTSFDRFASGGGFTNYLMMSRSFTMVQTSDGNMWGTQYDLGAVARIHPDDMTGFQSFPIGSAPLALAVGADGNLWLSSQGGGCLGRLTLAGAYSGDLCSGLAAGAHVTGMALGPDGYVWFADNNNGSIGRVDTSGTITEYGAVNGFSGAGHAQRIIAGPDGNMWFTDGGRNTIGKMIL